MASAKCSYTLEQVISLIDSENNDESSDSEFDSDGSEENLDHISKIIKQSEKEPFFSTSVLSDSDHALSSVSYFAII
jgi:hypothetical protein